MVYLDTSVALAHLLAEDRAPSAKLWENVLVSSRLLECELWCRLHDRRLAASHGNDARALLSRVTFVELARPVIERSLEPFPAPVRTLDALHLASVEFLRSHGQTVRLATYDLRMQAAAKKLRVELFDL